jgi:hypothetical protein
MVWISTASGTPRGVVNGVRLVQSGSDVRRDRQRAGEVGKGIADDPTIQQLINTAGNDCEQ